VNAFDLIADLKHRWHDLDSYDRHDLSVAATKLAEAQGASIPEEIFRYGGEGLSQHFTTYMKQRQEFTANPELQEAYGRLAKVASAIDPDELALLIHRLDADAGLTHRYGANLPDPHLCVFDRVKEASWSWTHGGHYVNEDQLRRLATGPTRDQMEKLFDSDFVTEFRKDPLGKFRELAPEAQIIIANMASQSQLRNDGGFRS
jgi:hypothetical protein